jgi:rubredoxin
MREHFLIKINFRGGIISPGNLLQVLELAESAHIGKVSFGNRQQLLIHAGEAQGRSFCASMDVIGISYEKNADDRPNVVSSYPAEEVFINKTWLSEGVYKDIFDLMDYEPRLKVNISNCNQSFTPVLTGNINWVASLQSPHFWHLFIRFPKTNTVYEWTQLVYTNDVARMSRDLETVILANKERYVDRMEADGDRLFEQMDWHNYITKPAETPATLPAFNLPYYEGLNRYNDKYWLGIYRRSELFSISFLKDVCRLCLETKVGQFCATPWKTILIKGIEEKHRLYWNELLALHRVNVRHAANELNFQVEDDCPLGLDLKNYLVGKLSREDMRTFGICIGIKTRRKSEVFSSLLVRRRHLLSIAGKNFFPLYDILCAKDFNPNERTGEVFCSRIPKLLLPGRLRQAILVFYRHQVKQQEKVKVQPREETKPVTKEWVYQCSHCMTVYSPDMPDDVPPADYCCPLCEAAGSDFYRLDRLFLYI